jgi:CheY-like chemotaxis protein/CHASE3 domain sensor protein
MPRSRSSNLFGQDDPWFAMDPRTLAGFLVAIAAVLVIAVLSYDSLRLTERAAASQTHAVEVLAQIQSLASTIKDAETGQRGFLLTGRENYLEPFLAAKQAMPAELSSVRALLADDPAQRGRLESLQALAADKMRELGETIDLKRAGKDDAALALVLTDRGKSAMDRIRLTVDEMQSEERQLITQRAQEWRKSATLAFVVTSGGSVVLLFLIAGSAAIASREFRARQRESWVRAGQLGLSGLMQGDLPLERLGDNILRYLSDYLNAQVGALFIAEGGGFRRVAGFALAGAFEAASLRPGDGLAGQAAKDNRLLRIRDVPHDYLQVSSATGRAAPAELLIAPASIDGRVYAVLELGFFGEVSAAKEQLLGRASEAIGTAVRAARDRSRLEELLQETQQQAQELQTREEELRVNNEELEEQGRTLRESRAQLESQQAELEQINAQLEEQTQVLEHQKDSLGKSHAVLAAKSAELQRANEYKSEFLANMSHELRTPLNSTLILAKLLADNKDGNLSETQVKYARTISSAGNDLLSLINDVLDLSRIEAGKIEVAPKSVNIGEVLEQLDKMFQPTAADKGIKLLSSVDPGTPEHIETDPQRLGQILKNLLSNALKFTQHGEIGLRVASGAPGTVSFAVRDTGVGIEPHQHEVIFEAFRQADGSIHRKFGGTGLGLSISRDLARLLGGSITVASTPGAGSIFTLTIPVRYSAPTAAPTAASSRTPAAADFSAANDFGAEAFAAGEPIPRRTSAAIAQGLVADDRGSLRAGARLILVVEDDASFGLILRDLAHEMGFQAIVVQSAGDALLAVAQFQPSAIMLDINLPDFSGLGVLDQLKRNPSARHIPVHVVSVADYRREALELGAVGYALKPAKREELLAVLKRLELRLEQSVRHVLIVEDDARQRESLRELLSNGEVQITDVATANEALRELSTATFDCVVLDFNLPDATGYDLLEKMAHQEEVSFPPVIVYTGRALSPDEEQRLGRYSQSIIIKDARSPERLLDEVTLFLHQVESKLPPSHQQMLRTARSRDGALEGRRILVVEDDVRNVFALTSLFEPKGAAVEIARNGREALEMLAKSRRRGPNGIDMVLMDIMMPEMDGLTAMREIRKLPEWKKLPIIALTAKAMIDDQEKCLAAGANDYIAKPLDVERLLSLVRVWMPK